MLGRDEGLMLRCWRHFQYDNEPLDWPCVSLLPLITALALVCLTRIAVGVGLMAGCGLLMALGFNTYLVARFIGGCGCLVCILSGASAGLSGGSLVGTDGSFGRACPLAAYYIIHPRTLCPKRQVSILMAVNQGTCLMLWLAASGGPRLGSSTGDFIPRHNIPLRPFLSLR